MENIPYTRAFRHLSRAWYGPANLSMTDDLDQIWLGIVKSDGGCIAEFCIKWKKLDATWAMKLEIFNNSWKALPEFSDLLQKLSETSGQDLTPDELVTIIRSLGIEDVTEEVNPDPLEYTSADPTPAL